MRADGLSLRLFAINGDIVECLPRARRGTYADDCSHVRRVPARLNTAHFALSTWLLANAALLLHIFEYKRTRRAAGNGGTLKSSNIVPPRRVIFSSSAGSTSSAPIASNVSN